MSKALACGAGGCLACDLDDVSVRYGDKQVLKDVTLTIPACTVTALLGPSGCGKSTLLNCLNRLSDHTGDCHVSGNIQWSDQPVYPHCDNPNVLRTKVGHIAQRPNPFPVSIRKNFHLPLIEHGIKSKGEREDRMQACLQEVGLWQEVADRLDRNALQLSGGQQQRLCIARALSLHPAALLLDEPTSALDPIATAKIEELITSLNGSYTIVLVTHNIAQAKRVAQLWSIFWTDAGVGCCVETGAATDLIQNPQDHRTAAYLSGAQG